jgi:hypothetical protein
MRRSRHAALGLCAFLGLLASCQLNSSVQTPSTIASFVFAKADNPALAADAQGTIDHFAKTIKVKYDPALSDFSALAPTIAVDGSATVYPASKEKTDFTQTPVTYKLVEKNGTTSVYYVTLVPKPVDAEAGAIRITEYFCGTGSGTGTTGELNRYLELYNGSSVAVDLSQFELAQRRSLNGVRDPDLDQVVTLKGSIAANSFCIIYSARANASLLAKMWSSPSKQSDTVYNGIMDSDGASGYELLKDGKVVDSIGPNDGSLYAKETCYYRRSVTGTGLPGPASAAWVKPDWASAPASGLLGDDANAGLASLTDTSLISLLVTAGSLKIPATIDNTAKTATVLMPDGIDASALLVSVGTFGTSTKIDGTTIENGKTSISLASGNKTLSISGQDGGTASYTLAAIPRYTSTNYTFDGGIKTVVDKIVTGGSYDTALNDVLITGIVTAKNIYPSSFFIQDKNAGVYFYTSDGISFPVGSKVTIKVTTGKVYYGMPEVTVYDADIGAAGTGLSSIYYRTGDYSNQASIGQVFQYSGSIAQGGLSYYKGQFTGNRWFHYPIGIESDLSAGNSGVFYGPVSFTRDNYTMELVTRDQYSLK